MTLSEEAYRACQRIWQEKGMRTFTDWLHFYNNLDFEPFLEALESMRDSYRGLGIDILKDAVPLPGVSMKYRLRGTLNKRDALELYAPGQEAYEILKGEVVGGPSLVLLVPLLTWYLYHGLKITAVHRTIDYVPQKIFTFFVNKVTENMRKVNQNSEQALLAEVFKLLGTDCMAS